VRRQTRGAGTPHQQAQENSNEDGGQQHLNASEFEARAVFGVGAGHTHKEECRRP
jgi:hypothetical protein